MRDAPPDLSAVQSAAIRWVAERALETGNSVQGVAQWTRALVVHMDHGLSPALKAEIQSRHPELEYFSDNGSPHNPPDEGFIEDGFAISFPRPRPIPKV